MFWTLDNSILISISLLCVILRRTKHLELGALLPMDFTSMKTPEMRTKIWSNHGDPSRDGHPLSYLGGLSRAASQSF